MIFLFLLIELVLNSSLGNRLAESIETSINIANGFYLLNMKMKLYQKNLEN